MTAWPRSGCAGERGAALATVMASTTVLVLLGIAALAYGVGSQSIARHDQDWHAALAAAEAGVDDYVFRLNENANYWVHDADHPPADPPAGDGNRAFTEWVPVPGDPGPAEFRYSVDAGTIALDGRVELVASGRVGDAVRSVRTVLRRRSFLDYLYYTDFETLDPALYWGTPFTPAQAQQQCAAHHGVRNPACIDINFVSGDDVHGPLHTNDALLVCGSPAFFGDTSTSWAGTGGALWRSNPSAGCQPVAPSFANPGDPEHLAPLTMPPSNAAIRAETAPGKGGCLYTGPTAIVFDAGGTMTVTSPFSIETNAACPTAGTGPLPANGVIYVQNVPSDPADPNHTAGCPFTVGGAHHPLGYPIPGDITSYGCRDGDAFVEGTLAGQVTVAAENDVVVTWHTEYADGVAGSDLLGLVANNNVALYHPVETTVVSQWGSYPPCPSGWRSDGTSSGPSWWRHRHCSRNLAAAPNHPGSPFVAPRIDAALLSVNHSFLVPSWNRGTELGTIHVRGAIAQRYRGPVGTTGGTGYLKDYVYDQRLTYLSPPKFLDPVASAWGVALWAEVATPADHT